VSGGEQGIGLDENASDVPFRHGNAVRSPEPAAFRDTDMNDLPGWSERSLSGASRADRSWEPNPRGLARANPTPQLQCVNVRPTDDPAFRAPAALRWAERMRSAVSIGEECLERSNGLPISGRQLRQRRIALMRREPAELKCESFLWDRPQLLEYLDEREAGRVREAEQIRRCWPGPRRSGWVQQRCEVADIAAHCDAEGPQGPPGSVDDCPQRTAKSVVVGLTGPVR